MSDFSILVLCTGNICRSPAGDLLLGHLLGESVSVSSAGTFGLEGHPIDPQMARLLPLDSSRFRARRLTPQMLQRADLVLAMTREHRSRAVETTPACVRRTFTFREFARIVSLPEVFQPAATPGEFLAAAVPQAGALRARAKAANPIEDDIIDPYGGPDQIFEDAYRLIEQGASDIARAAGVRG